MNQAIPYLTFPGTCREAMSTYADVFGGAITNMTTLGESPIDVPDEAASLIFNAEMRSGELVVKASDDPSPAPGAPTVSLFVTFDTSDERARVFAALAEGGTVLFEIEGPFSMVEDRFGTRWMLVVDETVSV